VDNLTSLIRQFNPRRTFSCSHSKIEVDGILTRVSDEDDESSWKTMSMGPDKNKVTHFAIAIEDLLQDPAIIRSARVSTGRDTMAVNEKAQGMVNFLWRDRHVTPFEGAVIIRTRWETPIMYAQPIFRLFGAHNEFSGRYSVIEGKYYTPSFKGHVYEDKIMAEFKDAEREAQSLYEKLLDLEVAKEMARYVHLYRFYTKFYFTTSLRHLLEFMSLKKSPNDRHSATEFWEIMEPLNELVKNWCPWAYNAFETNPRSTDYSWVKDVYKRGTSFLTERLTTEDTTKVLDKGYIKMIKKDLDSTIVTAALNDFPDPTKALNHGSMSFYVRMPIHVFRQWVRHRSLHFSELEIDFDSVVEKDYFYIPDRFRKQTGKIGHYIFTDMNDEENDKVRGLFKKHIELCKKRYLRLRGIGLSNQMAALNLPYAFYIDAILTTPLGSLAGGMANYLSLRTDGHAQKEIREYANKIWHIFKSESPALAEIFAAQLYYGDSEDIKNFRSS
jgi:thymidylate synthase (FAD)